MYGDSFFYFLWFFFTIKKKNLLWKQEKQDNTGIYNLQGNPVNLPVFLLLCNKQTKRVFDMPKEFNAQDHFEKRIRVPQEKKFGFFLDWGLPARNWSLRLTVNSSQLRYQIFIYLIFCFSITINKLFTLLVS